MSDADIAPIARELTGALKKWAHDRDPDDANRVRELQAILVRRCEQELIGEQAELPKLR